MIGDHRLFEPAEWLVKFRNPFGEYGQLRWETSFFTNELEFYFLAITTYIHAYRHGGRYLWLWWTTMAHGLMTELVSYWAEPIDNFWHAQSTFMFFGQREPLHIMCLYPGYIYTASVAVERLNLSELCESFTVALFVLLFDLPYDIVGVKMLWWTWHDTDANIRDRHYWVPWTSYYFHMTFAFAFSFLYNRSRRYFTSVSSIHSSSKRESFDYSASRIHTQNFYGELKACILTGVCSMPFGICQFVPGYHLFKDIFGVSGQVTTGILGGIYLCGAVYGLQHKTPINIKESGEIEEKRGVMNKGKGKWYYDEIMFCVFVHYIHYMILVVFSDPKNKQVLGLHQPMGSAPGSGDEYDCTQMRNLSYPYPFTPVAFPPFLKSDLWEVTVWKRPYICEKGYLLDEAYMDFNCPRARQQKWTPGNMWFWICGTDWTDGSGLTHVEYVLVVYSLCFIGMLVYTNALCYPRNLWTQFVVLGEFPKYYLTDKLENNNKKFVTNILDKRVDETTGEYEYLVTYTDRNKETDFDGLVESKDWIKEVDLMQDGIGQVYGSEAERFGLYGKFYDSYSNGSTRDRLKHFNALRNANERLNFYKKAIDEDGDEEKEVEEKSEEESLSRETKRYELRKRK